MLRFRHLLALCPISIPFLGDFFSQGEEHVVVRDRGCPGFGEELLIRCDLQAATEIDDAVSGAGFVDSLYSAPRNSDIGEVYVECCAVYLSAVSGLVGFPGNRLRSLESVEVEQSGGFVFGAFTLRLLLLVADFVEASLHAADFWGLRKGWMVAGYW